MKVFFVKYNDPIYVKLEKLDIMIRLTNASNIAQVLAELKEYVHCLLHVLLVLDQVAGALFFASLKNWVS